MRAAQPFDFSLLVFPCISIFIIGFYITLKITKSINISYIVGMVKTLFFFIYFNIFFNGYFNLLDDWYYYDSAKAIKAGGNTLLSFLGDNGFNLKVLMGIAGSRHFVYNLYNVLAFDIFGIYYFSPVALNIILTFFIGSLLYKIVQMFGIRKEIALIYYLFFVLHWDTILWSSILNIKDILVEYLTVAAFYNIFLFELKKIRLTNILFLVLVFLLFSFLRFYIPFFFACSYLLYKLIVTINRFSGLQVKLFLYVLLLIFFPIFGVYIIFTFFPTGVELLFGYLSNPIYGGLIYVLTPLPFHAADHYEFLNISSPFHFAVFPLFLYGVYMGFKSRNKLVFFMIIYFSFLVLFYGIFKELQGIRQRIQVGFIFAFFQLLGILHICFKKGSIYMFNR